MTKRMLAMLVAVMMVLGMIPVFAGAAASTPEITQVNMTLGGILGVNFKVTSNGADMSGYSVRVTIGEDTASQNIKAYTKEGDLYVYTAKLPAHRMPENIKVELMQGNSPVQTKENWTVASYLANVSASYPSLAALIGDLQNYGAYAAYYADPTGEAPAVSEVTAVTQAQLESYKLKMNKSDPALGATAALYIDDACDIRIKFKASAWQEDYTLLVDEKEVTTDTVDGQVVYEILELLPQNWSKLYHIQVVDGSDAVIMDFEYSVLSYAYTALGKATEAAPGLNGLLKAMFLYSIEAGATHIPTDTEIMLGDNDIDWNAWPVEP